MFLGYAVVRSLHPVIGAKKALREWRLHALAAEVGHLSLTPWAIPGRLTA